MDGWMDARLDSTLSKKSAMNMEWRRECRCVGVCLLLHVVVGLRVGAQFEGGDEEYGEIRLAEPGTYLRNQWQSSQSGARSTRAGSPRPLHNRPKLDPNPQYSDSQRSRGPISTPVRHRRRYKYAMKSEEPTPRMSLAPAGRQTDIHIYTHTRDIDSACSMYVLRLRLRQRPSRSHYIIIRARMRE